MSDDLEDEEPLEPKTTPKSVQPMPRLWKSEPEPTEEESPPAKKSKKGGESEPSKKSNRIKGVDRKRKDESRQGEGIARRG